MSEKEPDRAQEQKQLKEAVDQAHDKYRATGLAITVTITTLSTGVIYKGLEVQSPNYRLLIFALPILLGLVQQLLHYLGSHERARALSKFSEMFSILRSLVEKQTPPVPPNENPQERMHNLFSRAREHDVRSNQLFSMADRVCVATLCVFVLLCIALISCMNRYVSYVLMSFAIVCALLVSLPYIQSKDKK